MTIRSAAQLLGSESWRGRVRASLYDFSPSATILYRIYRQNEQNQQAPMVIPPLSTASDNNILVRISPSQYLRMTHRDTAEDITQRETAKAAAVPEASALAREAYVFGGALKDAAISAATDPLSAAKVAGGAVLGLGLVYAQRRAAPVSLALQAMSGLAFTGTVSSVLKNGSDAVDIFQRTWQSANNIEADRKSAKGIASDVVDFGLFSAGSMVAPAMRAAQWKRDWDKVADLPFFKKSGPPPDADFLKAFDRSKPAIGPLVTMTPTQEGKFAVDHGTLFTIDNKGTFLSAWHAISDGGTVAGGIPGRGYYNVQLLGKDVEKDLILGRLVPKSANESFPSLRLSERALTPGEPAMAIGFPGGDGKQVSIGQFTKKVTDANDAAFDIHTAGGFSGGPIIGRNAEVLALTTATRASLLRSDDAVRKIGARPTIGVSNAELRKFIDANYHNQPVDLPRVANLPEI